VDRGLFLAQLSIGAVASYVFPNVSPEESVELVVEYQRAKVPARKKRLLDRLLRAHLPLIKRLVRKAASNEKSGEDIEDLVQAGCIAFCTAVDKFDASRKTTLSTYLAHWVRHEVQQATRSSRTVRLPRIRMTNEERKAALDKVRANPEATADELGLSQTKVDQLKYSIGLRYTSTATEAGQRALERSDALVVDAGDGSSVGEAFCRALATTRDKPFGVVRRAVRAAFEQDPEFARRVGASTIGLTHDQTRALRVALCIDAEPSPCRPIRSPQLYFAFRDRVGVRRHLERSAAAAALRIDAFE